MKIVQVKSKITKILNFKENSKRRVPNQMAKAKVQHIKRMDNNCHIPDLVQAFKVQILSLICFLLFLSV